MNKWRRILNRIDPGFLVVAAIALIAVWPFLSRASLPQGTDAELHIFRLHELSYLVRNGAFFPRWAPNFYHGYGYPIFNYYAPLTYFLALPVDFLPLAGPVTAVKSIFVLGILLAAFGMYGFVRDNWGRPSGYIAAAVYIYAPYVQYIDPHARGVLPETFSLGAFAVALWALDRLRRGGTPLRWVTAVLTTTAVLISHNLLGPLFFGILLAWSVWEVASCKRRAASGESLQPCNPAVLLLSLFLSLALSSFFWIPVFLERNAVNLTTLIGQGDNYDFHTHFLTLREMLSFSKLLDWGATEPAFLFNLGVAQWILGGFGAAMLILRRVKHIWRGMFFGLSAVFLIFLMLPVSAFIWENLPFLPFFQFPWRLLGPTAAMLAILAGVGASALPPCNFATLRPCHFAPSLLVALPILLGLPLSQPAPWVDFGDVSTPRMSDIEHQGRWLGTTSTADYVPVTVDIVPERNGYVVAGIYEGRPLDRVNRAATMLPEGTIVESEELNPLHFRYRTNSAVDFKLRLFLFDFPGWEARVDGQSVETRLARPEGFITVPIPAGEHVVEVAFGSTFARTLGTAITFAAFAALLFISWLSRSARREPFRAHSSFLIADYVALAVVAAINILFLLILQPTGVLHYYSSGLTAEPAQNQLTADFGDQIALLGYDISAETAVPGDEVAVTLYWKGQRPMEIDYQVFMHLQAADGYVQAQSDKLNPGDFPTRRWPEDKYVRDKHILRLPDGLPPGDYTISTGLYVASEGWRLPLLDENGRQIDDKIILFTIPVTSDE